MQSCLQLKSQGATFCEAGSMPLRSLQAAAGHSLKFIASAGRAAVTQNAFQSTLFALHVLPIPPHWHCAAAVFGALT